METTIVYISAIIVVFIFKKKDIFFKGSFLKTFKAGFLYILWCILGLIFIIIDSTRQNSSFKPTIDILLNIFKLFSISFFEESLFRGLITSSFAKKYVNEKYGIIKILLYPSLIFGITHSINVFTMKINISASVFQILSAVIVSIVLTAIYLRGGNIFVPIIIHTIINANGLFNAYFLEKNITEAAIINSNNIITDLYSLIFAVFLPHCIFTIYLIRENKINDIKQNIISMDF